MWVPIAVKYGLTAEEFYRLNPKKIERYQPFLMAKYKAQKDDDSERGWINGTYVAKAIGASFSKKGRYPDHPVQFYEDIVDTDAEESKQTFNDADRFMAFATAFNKANENRFSQPEPEPKGEEINKESQ